METFGNYSPPSERSKLTQQLRDLELIERLLSDWDKLKQGDRNTTFSTADGRTEYNRLEEIEAEIQEKLRLFNKNYGIAVTSFNIFRIMEDTKRRLETLPKDSSAGKLPPFLARNKPVQSTPSETPSTSSEAEKDTIIEPSTEITETWGKTIISQLRETLRKWGLIKSDVSSANSTISEEEIKKDTERELSDRLYELHYRRQLLQEINSLITKFNNQNYFFTYKPEQNPTNLNDSNLDSIYNNIKNKIKNYNQTYKVNIDSMEGLESEFIRLRQSIKEINDKQAQRYIL